jgi:solute carrier family 8 (sodium/calcium exchanger)
MIREQKASTSHYYDIWHVARSIQKVLLNLSKEKGWERIAKIMKAVRTHLYWCATSIKEGFEELIIAKWKSFVNHVTNTHENHSDPLFRKCLHVYSRKWIYNGIQNIGCEK